MPSKVRSQSESGRNSVRPMHLLGPTFDHDWQIELRAKGSEVPNRENKKRFYKGKIIPSVVPEAYLRCFEPKSHSQ